MTRWKREGYQHDRGTYWKTRDRFYFQKANPREPMARLLNTMFRWVHGTLDRQPGCGSGCTPNRRCRACCRSIARQSCLPEARRARQFAYKTSPLP